MDKYTSEAVRRRSLLDAVGERVAATGGIEDIDVDRVMLLVGCHALEAEWILEHHDPDDWPLSVFVDEVLWIRVWGLDRFAHMFGKPVIDLDRDRVHWRRPNGEIFDFRWDEQLDVMVAHCLEIADRVDRAARRHLRRPSKRSSNVIARQLLLVDDDCRVWLERYRRETAGKGTRTGFCAWFYDVYPLALRQPSARINAPGGAA